MKTLQQLRGWTTPDEVGCWIWKGGYTQGGYLPVSHMEKGSPFGKKTMSAYRAAWLLSGRTIPEGHVVYRHVCLNAQCVNPAHCATGTKGDMHKRYSESGKNRGQPHRILANAKNRATQTSSPERIAAIQALLDEGLTIKAIMIALKTDGGTVRKIRDGVHPGQQTVQRVLPQASIFALARAA